MSRPTSRRTVPTEKGKHRFYLVLPVGILHRVGVQVVGISDGASLVFGRMMHRATFIKEALDFCSDINLAEIIARRSSLIMSCPLISIRTDLEFQLNAQSHTITRTVLTAIHVQFAQTVRSRGWTSATI